VEGGSHFRLLARQASQLEYCRLFMLEIHERD